MRSNMSPECNSTLPDRLASRRYSKPKCELQFQDGTKGCVWSVPLRLLTRLLYGLGINSAARALTALIQNTGVCTYGSPAPSDLPQGCSLISTLTIASRKVGGEKQYGMPTTGLVCGECISRTRL